jgi:DNA repair exonuclease SbcCD nuclease subunit
MKIAVLSDAHLNKSIYKSLLNEENTSLPFRTVDFMKAFQWDIDKIIEMKPDIFVLVGDTFDTFEPSSLVSGFFNRQIAKLRYANIKTYILVGNHDICRKHHALMPLKELRLDDVRIIQSPEMFAIDDHDNSGDYKILLFFPFSMEVERNDISIKDQFNSFITESKDKIKKNGMEGKEILFFGHFGVKGAILNQYTETIHLEKTIGENEDFDIEEESTVEKRKNFINNSTKDISLNDLDGIGASHVFLGDYHKHQILKTKKTIAMYTGSVDKTDFNERDQKKGFIFYDSTKCPVPPYGKCEFIEYRHGRPMIELKGNIGQMEKEVEEIEDDGKQPIIRILFVGNSQELNDFSLKLEDLKSKIRKKLNPIHVYHIQKVIDEEEVQKASEVEEEILEKGHMTSSDVIPVVNEMIDEKYQNDTEEAKILKEMSDDIYKTTQEG